MRVDIVWTIGTLDRCLSLMLHATENKQDYDEADLQTLKHHAEDMIGAGQKVLKLLEKQHIEQSTEAVRETVQKEMEKAYEEEARERVGLRTSMKTSTELG